MSTRRTAVVLLIILAVVAGLAGLGLRMRRDRLREQPKATPENFPHNGITPASPSYSPTIETNDTGSVTVTLESVAIGDLSRRGLDTQVRKLHVIACRSAPHAARVLTRIYASQEDRQKGADHALVSFRREGNGRPHVLFNDKHPAVATMPDALAAKPDEAQRRRIYLTLRRASRTSDQDRRALAGEAVAHCYSLTPEDLQSIREEGERKRWGGRAPLRKEQTL